MERAYIVYNGEQGPRYKIRRELDVQKYRVMFQGEILPGWDRETVKRNFVNRFRVGPHKLEEFFSGRPVALKDELDHPTALRLQAAVREAGGQCEVVTIDQVGEEQDLFAILDELSPPQQPSTPAYSQPQSRPQQSNPFPESHSLELEEIEAEPVQQNLYDPRQHRRERASRENEHKRMAALHKLGCAAVATVFSLIIGAILVNYWWQNRRIHQPPGMRVNRIPVQTGLDEKVPFEYKGYRVTPQAGFSLQAVVLSHKQYTSDHGAEISPIDLALGWGAMSDIEIIKKFKISQRDRFYFWKSRGSLPIPYEEVVSSSANMHMIPATSDILNRMKQARRGHVIALEGYLVNVVGPTGWSQQSSLTRDDSGGGACEVIYVEFFDIL